MFSLNMDFKRIFWTLGTLIRQCFQGYNQLHKRAFKKWRSSQALKYGFFKDLTSPLKLRFKRNYFKEWNCKRIFSVFRTCILKGYFENYERGFLKDVLHLVVRRPINMDFLRNVPGSCGSMKSCIFNNFSKIIGQKTFLGFFQGPRKPNKRRYLSRPFGSHKSWFLVIFPKVMWNMRYSINLDFLRIVWFF